METTSNNDENDKKIKIKILMDLRCFICNARMPSKVINNKLFIQAVCGCGWVAPPAEHMLRFFQPNETTDYDDIFLVWPRKTAEKQE